MRRNFIARNEDFTCEHCGKLVDKVKYGGSYRNHCPFCLYSKHIDLEVPGDRENTCGGLMKPLSAFTRRNGEHVLVHKCLRCGFERYNRIGGDDNFELVLQLSQNPTSLKKK